MSGIKLKHSELEHSETWQCRGCMPFTFFRNRAAAVVCALAVLSACASTPPAVMVVDAPPLRVVAEPVGPDGLESYDAETLFLRALDLLEGDAWADAADYFARLIREFPDDSHVVLAHYNLGVAFIHLGKGNDAVSAFDSYLAALPEIGHARDRLDGRFKRGQALAVARRYEEVVSVFDEMLVEALDVDDQIEALVDSGVGHYMLGLLPGGDEMHRPTAESRFLQARRIARQEGEKRRLDSSSFFTTQAAFYLAELAHLDFTEYKMKWPAAVDINEVEAKAPDGALEALLGAQLEEKCQRLLRAQYQYLRAIREGHAGWASAAGFKVGQMYVEMHQEMVELPAPSDLTPEQQEIYVQMVRKKVLILLEKAEKTWTQTADMVVRTGAEGEWGKKTRDSLASLRQLMNQEHAAAAAADAADKDESVPVIPVADAGKGKS